MEVISQAVRAPDTSLPAVALPVDRRTLAKTRWRATADDGQEFGFELTQPLVNGATVFEREVRYVIEQRPEEVLRIPLLDPEEGGRIGWMIGNLHFPAEVRNGALFVEADVAVRQMLAREHIAFEETSGIFAPIKAGGHRH